MIAEGCYPYVVGGVSSWIQTLITSMPEHQFILVSVNAYEKDKGKFKYTIPDNVIEIQEYFLDTAIKERATYRRKFKDDNQGLNEVKKLLCNEPVLWEKLFDYFKQNQKRSAGDFLMSEPFYDTMIESYKKAYDHTALADYFWTTRSMILPLLSLLRITMPVADVYHSASCGYAGVLATLAKYQHNKPMILTEHGIYTREREEEILTADWVPSYFKEGWTNYFYQLSTCVYQAADKVYSLFNNNKVIQVELGCLPQKIRIVPNGVDVERFSQIKSEDKENNQLNVGAIVRVVPIKDIITMIQSFRLVYQRKPNTKFYIMGPTEENPDYYEECQQAARLMGLSDVIVFTGRINIMDYLGKMDVMVLSSISEGQPLSILEAMAAGKCNVTTNVGSCKEILYGAPDDKLGQAGIVVPVMDYKAMSEAIIDLLNDERLREQMGNIALQRVRERYTKEQLIHAYQSIYKQYE
jgi:glycosyltransferase involved in cell wall biosynthesis